MSLIEVDQARREKSSFNFATKGGVPKSLKQTHVSQLCTAGRIQVREKDRFRMNV